MDNNHIPRGGSSDVFYPGLGNLINDQYTIPHATAPPCSEFSYNSTSEFGDRKVSDEETEKKWPIISDEEKRKEFNDFVAGLRDQVSFIVFRHVIFLLLNIYYISSIIFINFRLMHLLIV